MQNANRIIHRALGLLLLWSFCLPLSGNLVRASTYTADGKRILEKWTFPMGCLQSTDDNWIKPEFIRKNINVCLNAQEFGGGITTGSNPSRASKIIDGNLDTFWGPDENTDLKDWWIEINVGRCVSVTKVRMVFSDSGNPFGFFKIYTSAGEPVFNPGTSVPIPDTKRFSLIKETTAQNSEYVLEYDLSLRPVQYIRIAITKRAKNLQLAEFKVYSLGDNVTLGTLERGGSADAHIFPEKGPLSFDGDGFTGWSIEGRDESSDPVEYFLLNLGTLFWVDALRIVGEFQRAETGGVAESWVWYKIYSSDGSNAPDGSLIWSQLVDFPSNASGLRSTIHYFPSPKQIRYVKFEAPSNNRRMKYGLGNGQFGTIDELQLFGEGYIPEVTLTSDLIDVGAAKNLTSVRWVADIPAGTALEIRTRTGNQLEEVKHYYDKGGNEISRQKWEKTPPFMQGEMKTKLKAGADWSPWSRKYIDSGDWFLSPSPRHYVQFQVKMLSGDPFSASSLRHISFSYSNPLAEGLIAEIFPSIAHAALPDTFSYFIRSTSGPGNLGYDRVLIETPSPATFLEAKVDDIVVGAVSESDSDELRIDLPRRVSKSRVIEVKFVCTVFRNSTLFDAYVSNQATPSVRQRVNPGDAVKSVDSQTTTVSIPVTGDLLGNVSISSRVITPNGDGVNDNIIFDFSVFKVNKPRSITLTIYNLQGEVVKKALKELGTFGNYTVTWDGRDEAGKLVSPGVYLCQMKVPTDTKVSVENCTITVVY